MEIAITIVFVILVTVIFTLISAKNRNKSWEGIVTDIREHKFTRNYGDDFDQQEVEFIIKYKQINGKTGVFKINKLAYQKYFAELKIGDRLIKKSGEYIPVTDNKNNSSNTK